MEQQDVEQIRAIINQALLSNRTYGGGNGTQNPASGNLESTSILRPESGEVMLNSKLQYDFVAQLQAQAALDNQANSRAFQAHALRVQTNASTIDHLAQLGVVAAGQTGITDNQAGVSPIRTGTGDNLVAGAAPTNRVTDAAGNSIAAGIAESVQTNVTTQVSALSEQVLALGGTITTGLQAVSDSNASIAASLAAMASALTALAPKGATS